MSETVPNNQSGVPMAPRIFLSYTRDDGPWVKAFTAADWFGNILGAVRTKSYLAGDNLPFGELDPWLDECVGRAAVVIAFISDDYRNAKWTVTEWLLALKPERLGKLIFVPVMMDSDAKVWWADQRRKGGLSVLPDDYQYADFTDSLGKRLAIRPDDTTVTERIKDLAKEIRGMLAHRDVSPVSKGEADVVVLGHPTAGCDDDAKAQSAALVKELAAASLRAEIFHDRWRGRTEAAPSLRKDALFVQPVPALEAADYVASPGITSKNLERIGISDARVTLWLPSGLRDPAFERQAAAAPADAAVSFRTDTPAGLAAWLRSLRPVELAASKALALQIEDLGFEDETDPDPDAVRLAEELQDGLCGVVNGIVKPNPSPWPFVGFDPGLKDLITVVQGDRAIVAVHDLDIPPSTEVQTRKAIERKFQAMQDVVQLVETATQRQLNLFRAALVVRNPKVLPFFRYPHDGRYKDWRLLRFERPDDVTPLKPDPASKAYFRAQLAAWASPRKAPQPVH